MRAPWSAVLVAGALGIALAAKQWTSVLVVGLAGVGMVSGLLVDARHQQIQEMDLPAGTVTVLVEAVSDGQGDPGNGWVKVRIRGFETDGGAPTWDGPVGWLRGDVSHWRRTSRWWVRTVMAPLPEAAESRVGHIRPTWGGRASRARPAGTAGGWFGAQVAGIRARLIERLAPGDDPGRALLAGFLLGDTSYLGEL